MSLKKAQENSASDNGRGNQRKSKESTDHWTFLEEIEAPMWVDLTLEAQFMDQDINVAWFETSHLIHHMPSRFLKSLSPCRVCELEDSPLLLSKSPKLPESVSRSRGKHYKSRNWTGNEGGVPMDKLHPIRKLDGKNVSSGISTSTITTNSSLKKPISSFSDPKKNFNLISRSAAETSSSSCAVSKCSSLKPGQSEEGPKDTTLGSTSNPRGSRNTRVQRCKSFSSKSSVGSSYILGCKLESINSTAMPKEKKSSESKIATGLVTILHVSERQIPDTSSSSKHERKGANVKPICQESKLKVLGSNAPRRPLRSNKESRPVKDRAMTRPRQIASAERVALSNKENAIEGKIQNPKTLRQGTRTISGNGMFKPTSTTEGKIQNPKALKQGTHMISGKGSSKPKVKANGGKLDRTLTTAVARTYFR